MYVQGVTSGVTHRRMTALVISITSHHAFIDAFLRVCGHRPWALPTGGEYSSTLV